MSKPRDLVQARFDRLLAAYQRLSIFLLMPPLISAFSALVGLFNAKYNLTLCLALIQGIKPLFPDGGALWLLLISLGVVILFVPMAFLASKGKLWAYLVGMGLYAADFAYSFFLLGQNDTARIAVSLVMHIAFLIAYGVGLVFYFKADRLLKAHPKDILGK